MKTNAVHSKIAWSGRASSRLFRFHKEFALGIGFAGLKVITGDNVAEHERPRLSDDFVSSDTIPRLTVDMRISAGLTDYISPTVHSIF
ncbi:hypothetical protein N7456_001769 [Penicillium angulare]|uniref:Uncharacterized protein n=1 Tax=Penicillium angulare TaxID=116970 RepID=A0A9W9KP57_9EURO|nr:hypothetical protein N7456_001769 [Penicillium angulare]